MVVMLIQRYLQMKGIKQEQRYNTAEIVIEETPGEIEIIAHLKNILLCFTEFRLPPAILMSDLERMNVL